MSSHLRTWHVLATVAVVVLAARDRARTLACGHTGAAGEAV